MKTVAEINEKIRAGRAVVVTAEEMTGIVADRGAKAAAGAVDVVTTGTFGPMCSSGALLNVGHATPRMRIQRATLNGVPAYGGIAAVDLYLGATELPPDDPENKVFPGRFAYGGGHVIEDLIAGRDVLLRASSYGTDCYPRTSLETFVNIRDLNHAALLNPRNGYQNYNVAVNLTGNRPIYTYLGILLPKMANANFCSAGSLSPLLNDPHYRTIGVGSRIFLGGGAGYVFSHGTQHNPTASRGENGVPREGAGTLAVTGDMRAMSTEFVRGVSLTGYGVSLAVGLGIPIPVLDEEIARSTGVSDGEIFAPVVDYAGDYPNNVGEPLAWVSYADLRSGVIEVRGRRVRTAPLSSLSRARAIAGRLKEWIAAGRFLIGEPSECLPGVESGMTFRRLPIRPPVRPHRI